MKKLLSIILAVILIFALVPYSVLAESIIAAETESAKLRLLHTVWEELDTVEAEMLSSGADQTETVMAVYKAAVQNPDVDANSFSEISGSRFTFTVSGMHCLYDYEANRQFDSEPDASIEPVVVIPGKKGGPTDLNVLVIGPQYGHDSNFTSFYQDKAQSIADVTGGSVTVLQSYGATGPAIAAACQNAGIILIDAFGSNIDGYSYLCLMTDDGITSSDFSQGWAVSSGTYTCIDARYIKYHITSQLPNSIVWWSAGPCMASDVGGRTGSTLLNAGAGCVFGYSNSVTYSGDMYITRTFWNDMIDESTVAEAFAHTVAVNCPNGYAPNGLTIKAYPVVMSPVDPFPSNPDSPQTVYCDQTLFGGFESVDLEDCYLDTESIEIYRTYQAEIAFVRVPDNAYHYELAWGSEDESIAVISGKKRKAVITGVGEGSTRVYCDVSVDGSAIGRKYCSVNVLHLPNVNEAANVEGGDLLFDSPTESYPWATAVVDGRFAVRSGNKGVNSSTSTLRLVLDLDMFDTLSFDWRTSSETHDKLGFYVNNSLYGGQIGGINAWTTVTYTASESGTYTFEWRYTKDYNIHNYNDCGYVDNVMLIPNGQVALESCSLDGAVTVYPGAQATVNFNRVPYNANHYDLVWGSMNEQIAAVTGNKTAGIVTGVAEGAVNIYCDVVVDGAVVGREYCAVSVLPDFDLNQAANVEGGSLEFVSATADYPWTVAALPGRIAVRSGGAGVSQVTSTLRLVLYLDMFDTLSFDWRTSSETNDKLGFYVNDSLYGSQIGGNTDWTTVTYTAPENGTFTFEWRYTKDGSVSSYDDCGYVDNVMLIPNGQVALESCSLDGAVTVYPGAQATVNFNRVPYNANHYDLVWGSMNEQIAAVTGNKTAGIVTGVTEGTVNIYCDVVVDGAVVGREYCAVSVLPFFTLNQAANVEGGSLEFFSVTADYPWTVAALPGRIAVRSGGAGVSQVTSTLRLVTDMDADDTLSFDWKVSSETNFDKLGFYVNDSLYGSAISGATDWATITYTAPESGSFTFEWRYSKDVSVNSNDDCGYVDNVEYLPYDASDTHTVRFLDWDGTVLKTETVEHGGAATAPADPSRTGYTFVGWDKVFNNVKRDLDVTAQYQINTYTVTFNGAYNGTQEVQYGGNAELPVLDAEGVHYTFTVDGEPWDGTNITEDVTVVVGMEIDVYTVTFIDPITETVLKAEQVMYGCGATAPEVPEHPGNTFIGWDKDFSFVASDMTVYAQYEINIYTVTFTGVYSGTQQVPYGGDAEFPVLDAEGVHYTFTVDGEPWDGTNITSDVTVVVGMEIDVYTVTFIDPIADTVLKTEQVMYGCGATAPEAPEHYGYTFTGWSADYSAVTGDITVYALYDPVLFTVIFTDGLGNILSTQSVPYMSAAEPPETPQREGWEFDGWDADFSCIEQDTVVNALWERVYCTVTFTGVYIGTASVEYGCDCELPVLASPGLHYTFTVDGEPWDGRCVTASVTVTVGVAINTYTVTFLDWDGSVLKTQNVTHGASATAPDDPERKGYVFVGWDASFAGVTGDLTVNAVYEAIPATLLGDVDCDGEVTMADVSALAYYLLNSGAISSQGYANADVNGDGRVDVLDLPALCAMIV